MPDKSYFIGLMSGTSADGVDAALIETEADNIKLVDFLETELPQTLKQDLLSLNQNTFISLENLSRLHKQVADCFITASQVILQRNAIKADDVTAIGSHGQTIFHAPEIPMTLQIGHPAFIAKQTGITTVGDFRVDDMALGGQGAPFAPAFHQALFQKSQPCCVVNIGGIANISHLPGLDKGATVGWDTGPGNALMDEICQTKFKAAYDKNGALAQQGKVHAELLQQLMTHPYFKAPSPKSTGRDLFNMNWVESVIQYNQIQLNDHDLLATLTDLTAATIAEQIEPLIKQPGLAIWIVGGGAYNPYLISRIQHYLPQCKVASSQKLDINPSAVEAMLCGWLAKQRLENRAVKLSAVTGAKRDCVLGAIWHH